MLPYGRGLQTVAPKIYMPMVKLDEIDEKNRKKMPVTNGKKGLRRSKKTLYSIKNTTSQIFHAFQISDSISKFS